jgi:long-chain acyl-CoA synthetase
MLANGVRTLSELFLERVALSSAHEAHRRKKDGRWVVTTWAEFGEIARALAAGLTEAGVRRGDAVAILGPTCAEWCLLDIAVLLVGATSVGIYPTLPLDQVRLILEDSRAKALFVEKADMLGPVRAVSSGLPLELLGVFGAAQEDLSGATTFEALLARGRERLAREPELVESLASRVEPEDVATIIFTSGTTGRPKGVPLTHRNVLAMLKSNGRFHEAMTPEDVTLAFLPMAHVGEHVVGFFGRLDTGLRVAFVTSYETLLDEIKEVRPTYFGAVPRIFEKMYGRIRERVAQQSPRMQWIFHQAEELARRRARADMGGRPLSLVDHLLIPVFERLVYRQIRSTFGGRVKAFVSGSAPISLDVLEFFYGTGMKIVEVYGLSEACGIAIGNTVDAPRLGTVGRPLSGVSLKLGPDGEILLKGPMVFSGYLNLPEENRGLFDEEGYLHTGDVGELDDDGAVVITDRKKNLIKTSGGKFVAPVRLEALVKEGEPLVSQVYVHGDQKPYVVALVTLDARETGRVARELGIDEASLATHPEVVGRIERAVASANERLARFEQIKRHAVLARDFTIDEGTLTPTLKIKRRAVAAKYAAEIEALYRESEARHAEGAFRTFDPVAPVPRLAPPAPSRRSRDG